MTPRIPLKTRPEPPYKAAMLWRKALRFAHAARRNAEEGDWDPAVANAVNAVINVTDALVVQYLGVRNSSEAHYDAMNLLQGVDLDPTVRRSFLRHLESLLNVKNIAQYEGRLLDQSDADGALLHMDRAFSAVQRIAETHGWAS